MGRSGTLVGQVGPGEVQGIVDLECCVSFKCTAR